VTFHITSTIDEDVEDLDAEVAAVTERHVASLRRLHNYEGPTETKMLAPYMSGDEDQDYYIVVTETLI
jgi:hypothetical protein